MTARPQLIDGRTIAESRSGHIAGAIHVPITELGSRIASLQLDGTRPVFAICRAALLVAALVVSAGAAHDTYSVPLGLGIGQIWKRETTTYNLFVEPQASVADKGAGWPKWQVFVGFNMVFR